MLKAKHPHTYLPTYTHFGDHVPTKASPSIALMSGVFAVIEILT